MMPTFFAILFSMYIKYMSNFHLKIHQGTLLIQVFEWGTVKKVPYQFSPYNFHKPSN